MKNFLIKFGRKNKYFSVDKNRHFGYNQNMKKKKLNNNFEVYNYLNVTNRKLGKLYKYTGTNCLPAGFDVNEQTFQERLLLNEMENADAFPPFEIKEKKEIKKHFKNSLKNIQKIKKMQKKGVIFENFSENFKNKVDFYLELRHELTHSILQDFEDQNFDEIDAYRQIFNLDPVFGECLEGLFEAKVDFSSIFEGLEEKYEKSYLAKLKKIEKKNQKKRKKSAQKNLQLETTKNLEKSQGKDLPNAKKIEKTAKNAQKAQNLKDAEQVRKQNKKMVKASKAFDKNNDNKEKT